jgi:hypothetical protein
VTDIDKINGTMMEPSDHESGCDIGKEGARGAGHHSSLRVLRKIDERRDTEEDTNVSIGEGISCDAVAHEEKQMRR